MNALIVLDNGSRALGAGTGEVKSRLTSNVRPLRNDKL